MRTTILSFTLLSSALLSAQSITPSVIGSAGGSGAAGATTLSWTVGEVAVSTLDNGSNILTQGFHQSDPLKVRINIAAFLQGPYNSGTGLMNDALRANGLVPLTEPYTALGFQQLGGGSEGIDASVLNPTGNDAIVDWIYVQLRDKTDNLVLVETRCALLQRDGDVVDTDGVSPLRFNSPADQYFIAVFHRNHLGMITLAPIALGSTAVLVDFTDGSTATYGSGAQAFLSGSHALWSGDARSDGVIKYTGLDNDRDLVLQAIGGVIPTNTVSGYRVEDLNMDGLVRYTGLGNDRDIILQNIGGVVPTNVRVEQLP